MDEKKQIEYTGNVANFKINTKIYPLDVIYSAAYILIDKAFILLDGDPETEITVIIEPKSDQEIVRLVHEFNDELLNYSVYKIQSEKNKSLREALMKRVLITNEVINILDEIKKEFRPEKLEDPEDIFKSWEEKEKKRIR